MLVAAGALAVRARRTRPWLALGCAWYVVTLLPVIGLVQVGAQAMADRYTYVPLTGLFVAAAWSLSGLTGERRALRAAAVGAVAVALALFGLATRSQARIWRDEITLFTHAERAAPGNWIALGALGDAAGRSGDPAAALGYYRRALDLRPESPTFLNNVGNSLVTLGRPQEAEPYFRQVLALRPRSAVAHYNLAKLLETRGADEEAAEHYRATIRENPLFLPAFTNLGLLLARQRRFGEAAAMFRRALELDPAAPDGHFNLALALSRQGRDADAVAEYRAALARRDRKSTRLNSSHRYISRMPSSA
jgi:tetratricopeptide (TPR) repeat protein